MFKNIASQTLDFFAYDSSTGAPKTGDAANITMYVSIDDGSLTALTDTSAAEISSSNAPGRYRVDVSQAETNGNKLTFSGKSSTSNVVIIAPTIYTRPSGLPDLTIANNAVASNTTRWNGTAVAAPATAGVAEVNVKNINNVSASAVTTVKAVQGLAVDGVVPTVTDLTNAPTNGDLTAAMKASVNAEADQALVDYDALVPADLPANFASFVITTDGKITLKNEALFRSPLR